MHLRIFFLFFYIYFGHAETSIVRVRNLIVTLVKNLETLKGRPTVPEYLQDIGQFIERDEPSSSSDPVPALTRHHVVPGEQLSSLYRMLLTDFPDVYIEIVRSIFFNLPETWRNENHKYLEGILCLDVNVTDESIKEINCEDRVKLLYSVFYWRPDNLQIGPTNRFRNSSNSYDFDCFYLLRGEEMVYSINFLNAIESILDNGEDATEEDVSRLLCANRRMIAMRNTPRHYYPREWLLVDTKMECWRLRRNAFNWFEKLFDLKPDQQTAIKRARTGITLEIMKRLISWSESTVKKLEEQGHGDMNSIRKLLYEIKTAGNDKIRFTTAMVEFVKEANQVLEFTELLELSVLHASNGIFISEEDWKQLFKNYLVDPTMTASDINALDNFLKDKRILTISNILKTHKAGFADKKGYVSLVKPNVKYNHVFLRSYLELEENLASMFNFDYENATFDGKEFKENYKKDDDDPDDEETKKIFLQPWWVLLGGMSLMFEQLKCPPNLEGESMKNDVSASCQQNSDEFFEIMERTPSTNLSPEVEKCSMSLNENRGVRYTRVQRDTSVAKSQLCQLVDEVYQNIESEYPFHRSTVFYQLAANRMHPLIKKSFDRVCHVDEKKVNKECKTYRYPGCFPDQPVLEKATIVMDKIACHSLNILSFGIGYFFITC